jgi:ADP-heptose:LPS heptosyltransferase
MSELERNAEFMRGLGIDCSARLRPLPLPERSRAELGKLADSGGYFVIFPGASWEGRCWPASAFAEVARRVAKATGWQGVVAGGPDDRDATSAVVRSCEVPLLDLTGATNLLELAVLLKGARLVVSNETSAAHLGAALSTPSICILGGGHFARFLPYPAGAADEFSRSVFRPMDCFNCNWQCRYPRNPGEPVACIKAVSIEEVCQAAKELLASSCKVPSSAWERDASA